MENKKIQRVGSLIVAILLITSSIAYNKVISAPGNVQMREGNIKMEFEDNRATTSTTYKTIGWIVHGTKQSGLDAYNREKVGVIVNNDFKSDGTDDLGGDVLASRNDYDLDWLLGLNMGRKFSISKDEYLRWVWKVFMLDMLIGNFDRHENNWGFLKESNNIYTPAPLFDMGASFYPKLIGEDTNNYNDSQIRHIIEFDSRCAILYNGKKKNYFDLLGLYVSDKHVRVGVADIVNEVIDIDLNETLNYVSNYNKFFDSHTKLVKKVVAMKLDMLRRFM